MLVSQWFYMFSIYAYLIIFVYLDIICRWIDIYIDIYRGWSMSCLMDFEHHQTGWWRGQVSWLRRLGMIPPNPKHHVLWCRPDISVVFTSPDISWYIHIYIPLISPSYLTSCPKKCLIIPLLFRISAPKLWFSYVFMLGTASKRLAHLGSRNPHVDQSRQPLARQHSSVHGSKWGRLLKTANSEKCVQLCWWSLQN